MISGKVSGIFKGVYRFDAGWVLGLNGMKVGWNVGMMVGMMVRMKGMEVVREFGWWMGKGTDNFRQCNISQ